MKKKGLFITFEGIDGSGKTTQWKLTGRYLRRLGYPVLMLREPGSTPLSERIRRILLDKRLSVNATSELNLYLAARAELVGEVIVPALRRGEIVVCDRFHDSTMAYQGYGRGIDINLINKLNDLATGAVRPDLTFLVDIDYRTSLSRRKKSSDRLELESRAFFNRVRSGFLALARKEKGRFRVLDGREAIDTVFDEVIACLNRKLNR
ncbi:MAG: dTMP kinase [Candidatus Zixiibacteriota bacterium]|nr:MAG: dTMP kinase [candidate division Zixibacteria bacterium]